MTSERKASANRINSRASTGPKSQRGRANSARNALRHGLSVSIGADPIEVAEIEKLAREIAGTDATGEINHLAYRIAEAQLDLVRVRNARRRLLWGSRSRTETRSASQPMSPLCSVADMSLKALRSAEDLAPHRLMAFLSDLTKQLLAIDRYERRAWWHRKCALRGLDFIQW